MVDTRIVVLSVEELEAIVERAVRTAMGSSHQPLLVDKQSMAQKLGCSAAHIDNLRKQGLPVVWLGEAVRFDPPKVVDWLRERSGPLAPPAKQPRKRR
jgi:hypothetical protein